VRITTSAHDARGYLTKNPADIERINQHLEAKIAAGMQEIALLDADLQDGAETLLISYGITARSVEEAVALARGEGRRVSALTVHSMWPIPEREIKDALADVRRVVVAELNQGQYRREIERLVGEGQQVVGVHRVDGDLISPGEILAAGGLR
jgi:2-oxoglutarate ferredoxin oxidoreductase subunit alpha